MTLILFPRDSLTPRKVDFAFAREWVAATAAGFQTGVFDELHLDLDSVPEGNGETAIYRGWMLSTAKYADLYHAMWKRGYHLINEPGEYRYCHELPSWYPDFENSTPKSVWFRGLPTNIGLAKTEPDWSFIVREVRDKLGDGPYIVKDFVKSRKHEWDEACYIGGPDDIQRVASTFTHRQGTDLAGGLVFRKFQAFKRIGEHSKSGMPLVNETRIFVVRGQRLITVPYWSTDEIGGKTPEEIVEIAAADVPLWMQAKSNFYTVDVAQIPETLGGGWIVIELGDGQVAGLPEHVDAEAFYRKLKARLL